MTPKRSAAGSHGGRPPNPAFASSSRLCLNEAMSKKVAKESDNAYFLKLLIYFVLGTIWVKINGFVVIPLGLLLGLIVSSHDHFAIDRKVEYAVLIIAAVLGLTGWGVYLAVG